MTQSSTYRAVVLEHFRNPRNRSSMPDASHEAEGANTLCGDRVRIQLRLDGERIADVRFTADACALCIASASLLTDAVRGMAISTVKSLNTDWIARLLGDYPPSGRLRCAMLPVNTLIRAVDSPRGAMP